MHKLLLTQPPIGSYSAFLLGGLLAGYLIARWHAVRNGITGSHIDNLALLIPVASLFGARLFSWLFYFPPGISFWHALTNPSGGMVLYGGIIFGLLTLAAYAVIRRIDLRNLLDAFAPALALGLAFGRIGCFMAGCCWGDLCVDPARLARPLDSQTTWQIRTAPPLSPANFPLAVRFPRNAGAYEQHLKLGLIGTESQRSLPVH